MEAIKSFKAYQYFAGGFVANVCTQKLHREYRSLVTEGILLCISEGQDNIYNCSRCAEDTW